MILKLIRNYLVPVIVIIVGGQVLFNLAFSLLGIPYALQNKLIAEFFLVFFGYAILASLVLAFLTYAASKEVIKDTLWATLSSLPLIAICLASSMTLYGSSKILIISLILLISLIYGSILFIKKMKWFYFFALLYVDSLVVWIILFDIQI